MCHQLRNKRALFFLKKKAEHSLTCIQFTLVDNTINQSLDPNPPLLISIINVPNHTKEELSVDLLR